MFLSTGPIKCTWFRSIQSKFKFWWPSLPLEVLTWVMTACWVLHSWLIYFWRNMNISGIFYFSKSTSINKQYSSLWDTLKMMLFTKYLIKWKCIGRISWKCRYWFNLKSSIELDINRSMLFLSNTPLKCGIFVGLIPTEIFKNVDKANHYLTDKKSMKNQA